MRTRFVSIVAMFLLAMPGCVYRGYYPNGYYGPTVPPPGPYGYPGPVNQPGSYPIYQPGGPPGGPTYQPGGPTYQPGGIYPTPINPGDPNNLTPGGPPTNPGDPQTYGTGGNNSAPPFNSTPNNSNPGGVPDPGNDGTTDFNKGTNNSPLITPTSSARSSSDLSTPFNQQESRIPRSFADDPAVIVDEPFSKPVIQTSGNSDGGVQQAGAQKPSSEANSRPYAHHPRFSWVQGTVEYDEPTSTWVLMYDDNPRSSDPYGGELTITGDLSRARLRPGDAIRLDGSVDPTQVDSRGKPVFQATKWQKL